MPEEGEEEDNEDDNGVVHTEVSEVEFDARESVVEVRRESEGAIVGDLTPWTAVTEAVFETLFGAGDVFEVGGGGGRGGNGAVIGHGNGGRREAGEGLKLGIVRDEENELGDLRNGNFDAPIK